LTICTLGVALGSLGTLAVPGLMNATMAKEVRQSRLFDVAFSTRDLVLSTAEMHALDHRPDVAAFDAEIEYSTTAIVEGNRVAAVVWGLDLASQPVDKVELKTGTLPVSEEVLGDTSNASAADLSTSVGSHVDIRTGRGSELPLVVTGLAHSLATSPSTSSSTSAVFYASTSTVRALSGIRGYDYLAFRLTNNSLAAQATLISTVRHYLIQHTGGQPFVGLPTTRANTEWPGRSSFLQVVSLFYIITALALLSALFLIANTMNTLVVEQGSEIAILKALGGGRRRIRGVVVRTAALLGAMGAVAGAVLGVLIATLLTDYLASSLFDVHATFAVSVPVVVASLLLGPALAVMSSLPGLRRAIRKSVADVLNERASSGYGTDALDRFLARSDTGGGSTRMGLRNVLRHKRRSIATISQITLAVALGLALFAAGQSATSDLNQIYGRFHYQVEVDANLGAPVLSQRALDIARTTPGVSSVEQVIETGVQYQGQEYPAYGLGSTTLYRYQLSAGSWFPRGDAPTLVPDVVLGPAIAQKIHASIGERLVLQTAGGPITAKVIGIDTGQWDNGSVMYLNLSTLQHLTGMEGASNALWLTTDSSGHSFIDRVSNAVEARLGASGFPVQDEKLYVEAAQNRASNAQIITVIEILGLLVAGITLIGLIGTLTMGVLERRREIGILRSIGATSRQVRRVFSIEGLVMAVIGWALGSLLGWPLLLGLIAFVDHDFGVNFASSYSLINVPEALVLLVLITLLVIRAPLRRAAHVQPSAVLRYQ
jgi:putative ABC transport system permease protein